MSYDFDLFVIGAGSGGVRAARMAATYGARVGIAEEYRFGGTCVIRGCVPKKLLFYASCFDEEFRIAKSFGWSINNPRFDWKALLSYKDKEIARLEGQYKKILDHHKVVSYNSGARILEPNRVHLRALGTQVTAENILIATGSTPFMPAFEGAEYAITSNEAFDLERLPQSLLVVGGGYIAVEFAGIFNGFGVKTCLNYRGSQILQGFDHDLGDTLTKDMQARGIDFKLETVPTKIELKGAQKQVSFANGDVVLYDEVMMATGRVPKIADLGLEAAGVETDSRNAVKVDAYSRTNVAHIFAVGDVTNRANLTPVAIREGAAVAQTLFNNTPTAVDYRLIPTAVFSQPEIGTVGMSEEQASKASDAVAVYVARFRPMKNTFSQVTEKIMFKLITDDITGRVLGCHITGHGAGEIIQLVGITLAMGATKADFDRTMAVHPTAAEELVTLKQPSYRLVNGEKVAFDT